MTDPIKAKSEEIEAGMCTPSSPVSNETWMATVRECNEAREEVRRLRVNVEYWRLCAERRDNRKERTGLDIPEARTLDGPAVTPHEPVGGPHTWTLSKEAAAQIAEIEDNIRMAPSRIAAMATPPAPGERATEWQPIETAPKDGTKIDLLFAYPRGRQNDCQWRQGGVYGDGDWFWSIPQWGSQPGLGIDWHLLPEDQWETGNYPNMKPTHWMVPPALPRADRGGAEQ